MFFSVGRGWNNTVFETQNHRESNTSFLLINNNWAGLIIDGSKENMKYVRNDDIYWKYNLKAVDRFITVETIDNIFRENMSSFH